jgi:hypothetical protein
MISCVQDFEFYSKIWYVTVKRFVPFILFFVNFAMKRVILIFNAQAIIVTFLIQ